MRFSSHPYLAIILSAPVAATLMASLACHSAQKPATAAPSTQAQAPALTASNGSSTPQQKPAQQKAGTKQATAKQGKQAGTKPKQAAKPTVAKATSPASAATEPQSTRPTPREPVVNPAVDRVAELIAAVEKQYKSGEDEYRSGHLEAAKQDFDSAFNRLLGGGIDLHSDDRLQHELDRVLEGISGLELAALQQGDGFSEQKSEPAPIDEANELNPPVDQNVKAKAEAEIKNTRSDLPLVMTDQVAGFINYFSGRGRGTLEHGLARSGRYEDMIRRVLREEGVPQELIYLAQAESGFHPLAVSRAGARGMWQFMGSRAKGYGLERSWWVDDRQDPEKATHAAAHHLHDLYNEFGDWYLAMAAYNSGPGTVQSAVKRTGYADFWQLYNRNVLPKETRNYVPIIVAVTIMAKNPAQYGLDSVVKDKAVPYDTVKINYPIDLRLAAECVDASASDLLDLNPSLLRLTTPKNHSFDLHLPAGTADKFQSSVASIPADKRVWWRYHRVQGTETLASVARTYHTTARAIAEVNDLTDHPANGMLSPDTRLIIPVAAGKQSDTSTYAHATTRYKVRRGDTVESVAENFGVSVKMLRVWNRLKGDSLAGRKVLYLHLPVTATRVETQVASARPVKTNHAASAHAAADRSASDHAASDHVASTHVASTHAASVQSTSSESSHHAETQPTPTNAVLHHKVKAGETLFSIASSYNTSVTALKRDNRDVAILRPGMILVVRDSH
jgi:membrane-bound lytic murein transglycosylase D